MDRTTTALPRARLSRLPGHILRQMIGKGEISVPELVSWTDHYTPFSHSAPNRRWPRQRPHKLGSRRAGRYRRSSVCRLR